MNPRRRTCLQFALLASLLGAAVQAVSHTRWDPEGLIKPRSTRDDNKRGPCGAARTDNPVVLQSGSTVEVAFESTIYHQGVFRIAFSPANDEGFDSYVLADNIPDINGQRARSHTITLPDMECDACTLQLIQTMPDRSPPSNYFSCADIRLTASGQSEPDAQDTTPPAAVSGLLVLPGDGQVQLMWSRPADPDYLGVLVAMSEFEITAQPQAGQAYQVGGALQASRVVFAGDAGGFTAGTLTAGATYHFAAFAYDRNYNYSQPMVAEVALDEQMPNIAPAVSLISEQDGLLGGNIDATAGPVLVQANITDINPSDMHTLVWSASDPRLRNTSSNTLQFRLEPAGLPAGSYTLRVEVTDDGKPPLSTAAELQLTVQPARAAAGGSLGHSTALFLLLGALWLMRLSRRHH